MPNEKENALKTKEKIMNTQNSTTYFLTNECLI